MSTVIEKINEKKDEILKDKALQESTAKDILNKEVFTFLKETKDYEKLDTFFSILFELYKTGNELPLLEYLPILFQIYFDPKSSEGSQIVESYVQGGLLCIYNTEALKRNKMNALDKKDCLFMELNRGLTEGTLEKHNNTMESENFILKKDHEELTYYNDIFNEVKSLILGICLQAYQQKMNEGISNESKYYFSELILFWTSSGLSFEIPKFEKVQKSKHRVTVLKSPNQVHEDEPKDLELDEVKKMEFKISALNVLRQMKLETKKSENSKIFIDTSIINEFISMLKIVIHQMDSTENDVPSFVHEALYSIYLKSLFYQQEDVLLHISSILNIL
eukprot:gene1496-12113_t